MPTVRYRYVKDGGGSPPPPVVPQEDAMPSFAGRRCRSLWKRSTKDRSLLWQLRYGLSEPVHRRRRSFTAPTALDMEEDGFDQKDRGMSSQNWWHWMAQMQAAKAQAFLAHGHPRRLQRSPSTSTVGSSETGQSNGTRQRKSRDVKEGQGSVGVAAIGDGEQQTFVRRSSRRRGGAPPDEDVFDSGSPVYRRVLDFNPDEVQDYAQPWQRNSSLPPMRGRFSWLSGMGSGSSLSSGGSTKASREGTARTSAPSAVRAGGFNGAAHFGLDIAVTPRNVDEAAALLGIQRPFSAPQVRAAYVQAAMHWHPDRPAWLQKGSESSQRATAAFRRAKVAHDLLLPFAD